MKIGKCVLTFQSCLHSIVLTMYPAQEHTHTHTLCIRLQVDQINRSKIYTNPPLLVASSCYHIFLNAVHDTIYCSNSNSRLVKIQNWPIHPLVQFNLSWTFVYVTLQVCVCVTGALCLCVCAKHLLVSCMHSTIQNWSRGLDGGLTLSSLSPNNLGCRS